MTIRQREARVAALDAQGLTQAEIAAEVGISQPAVCKALRRLDDRSRADTMVESGRARARLVRWVLHQRREALRAFGISQQGTTRRRQRKRPDGQVELEVTVTESAGDHRLLAAASRATEQLADLYGFDDAPPTAPSVAPSRVDYTILSDEALAERLVALKARLQAVTDAKRRRADAPSGEPSWEDRYAAELKRRAERKRGEEEGGS